MDEKSLHRLVEGLAESRSLDLRGYKSSTLGRRVSKRMVQAGAATVEDYLALIEREPAEIDQLLGTVLINVTEFFRDPLAWEFLRGEVLPKLIATLRQGETLRAWSVGCATGEEPYSLAILLADVLGERLGEFDIKIYATDNDEHALTAARRAVFPIKSLRRLRPEWRATYFSESGGRARLSRELRRMVIFGRSDLIHDAPISHCHLVICRNVLIYFDTPTQRQILNRLHYGLEPNGILWLGKAESKLSESHQFRQLHARWRVFQRLDERAGPMRTETTVSESQPKREVPTELQAELERLRAQHRLLLAAMTAGTLLLDAQDEIKGFNDAALRVWNLKATELEGRRLQSTEVPARCPELAEALQKSKHSKETVTFQCRLRAEHEESRSVSITIRPVVGESGVLHAVLISGEDLNPSVQLESKSHELQSANEELETTNEELQSTNEELETTNEELQSTNEELETTNEELQSLNEELENMNEELEARTRELDHLTSRYAETLKSMPWPIVLVDGETRIQLWNKAAQLLFGVSADAVVGIAIERLPLEASFCQLLTQRVRTVLATMQPARLNGSLKKSGPRFEIQLSPVTREVSPNHSADGVLLMFSPQPNGNGGAGAKALGKTPTTKKKPAAKAKKKAVAQKSSVKKSAAKKPVPKRRKR